MGVLVRETNIGEIARTPGFPAFEEDCWEFFKLQVSIQKPRAIVALGKEVVRVLCPSNRLNMPYWQLKKSDAYGPLRLKAHDVEINLLEGKHKTKLIAAYHPSFGRSAAQIDMLVEDSKLIAGCPISRFSDVVYSRRNSPHSTT
jgi:uracil-DNA glycosylase